MLNKKSINVFVDHYFPVAGGLSYHCTKIYTSLVKRGWNVSIHTTRNTHSQKNVLPSFEEIDGVKVNRYNFRTYNFNPFKFAINYFKTDAIVLNELIIFPHYFIYIISVFLKIFRLKKYALVLTSHGLFSNDISTYRGYKRKIKKIIDRTVGVFLVRIVVDHIHAVSYVERDAWLAAGVKLEKVTVFGNGLDQEAYEIHDKPKTEKIAKQVAELGRYYIQIGRIDRVKNFDIGIRALPRLPRDINFVILGDAQDGEYKNDLLRLAKELGVQDRVFFMGIVRGGDKYFLIRKSIAYVHLAKSEAFGLVVLEAMSQGCVCVVSRGTGVAEYVIEGVNGFQLEATDVEGLTSRINFVLSADNTETLQKMKNLNISEAQKQSWETIALKMEDLLINAIGHV